MHHMRWSWEALQNTPLYVRRFCADLMNISRRAEAAAAERRQPAGHRG